MVSRGERSSEALGSTALEVAVAKADEHLDRAYEERTQDNMNACRSYLKAASAAITGLEEEYDQILVEAKSCLDRPEKISDVKARIDRYLRVHRLRRRLNDAMDGIGPIRDALQRRANYVLQWHWNRRSKQEAVERFAELLQELNNYIEGLEATELKYRRAGTGVAVKPLDEIERYLGRIQQEHLRGSVSPQDIPPEVKSSVITLIEQAQADRTKDHLLDHTARIHSTIQQLKQEFKPSYRW